MNNPIDITPVIPVGMNRDQALKLAKRISKTMRSMWVNGKNPIELTPEQFCSVALRHCRTVESKRFLTDKIKKIITPLKIKQIINSKNNLVTFSLNGEEITTTSKKFQPA